MAETFQMRCIYCPGEVLQVPSRSDATSEMEKHLRIVHKIIKSVRRHEKPCEKKDLHPQHEHYVERVSICSGLTDCGQQNHPSHDYTVQERVWCLGRCGCGLVEEPHGAGIHRKIR